MSTTSQHSSPAPSVAASFNAPSTSSIRPDASKAQRTADAKKAFLSTFTEAARDIDNGMQWRATAIHENAEALIKQEKDLDANTKQIEADNEEAEKWLKESAKKLEEFGDLEEIEAGLEDDLETMEIMLELMEKKQKEGKYDEPHDKK